ncbi:hypothetical protein BCR32DRAFT_291190 [Anaeromyces robustus]|uniref:CBM10 domain-containing protein n=1 Tax=Anaeromyces robustus TaxID=1754192 RepID=A0A1Y1XFW6_9FUNG|nr:hypothetical protein BCR32DRAFT_291190 [Anaeromyces robustus]|eukprot:ORX84650.1 hypothetical protein BCR32DRAFT_291190 [Anaeromyces robustus]
MNNFNFLILFISLVFINIEKTIAIDSFFKTYGNVTRTELFEKTDFKVPTIKINLNETEYTTLFLSFQCNRDCSPNFLKRNEKCYTAPWVDLNYALNRCINKKYIDISNISPKDSQLVNSVNANSHNVTLSEFENMITTYSNFTLEEIFSHPYHLTDIPSTEFETNNASMNFKLEKEDYFFPQVKFSFGGRSTKAYSKLSYNINIKNGGLLFGCKQLRLRAEVVDPSFLREKMAYDLHNVIGLPSLSANFARLYINDTFMGFYLLRDAFKSQWVENNFGEKNTKHIYKCDEGSHSIYNCKNDDDNIDTNKDKDYKKFIEQLDKAKSREDLEKFFDVKTFIRWQAARYLFGSWDHKTNGPNNVIYLYHNTVTEKDMWIPLLYDFDMNFGHTHTKTNRTFSEEIYDPNNKLFTLLKLNDENPEILSLLQEYMKQVFNPLVLVTRVNQLKVFIEKYIKEDRTPDAEGKLPGRFDKTFKSVRDTFDYNDFKKNTEFTTIRAKQYNSNIEYDTTIILGIKQWIIERFKFVCSHYKFDCSYSDTFFETKYANYTVDEIRKEQRNTGCNGSGYSCCIFPETQSYNGKSNWGVEGNQWCVLTDKQIPNKIVTPDKECWSYLESKIPCCQDPRTKIKKIDEKGKEWGEENNEKCGITKNQYVKQCPDYATGYSCCYECNIVYNDGHDWGIENGKWCSIPYSCNKK